jgi:uncharacterized protein DUF1254
MSNHWSSHKSLDDRKGVDRRSVLVSGGSLLASSALIGEALNTATSRAANAQVSAATSTALPSDQIGEVAANAYLYAYPLILMELTRRIATNVADTRRFSKAPMNQFANVPAFPDATYTDIVRPNQDTLYSLMWFDVSKEPLLISVPDSGGRYYLLPMLDMWTDVFNPQGSARLGRARSCLRSRSRAGKAHSMQERCSFVVLPRSAGSSGARRPTAKPITTLCTNSRTVWSLRPTVNGANRTCRRRVGSIPIGT